MTDYEKQLPPLDAAVIQALDELFPVRYPPLDAPIRDMYYVMGQRSVVEFLIEKLKQQEERALEGE